MLLTILYYATLLRIPIFLLVGVESLATFFLYRYGYFKFKPTKIISILSYFFLFLGLDMIYQSFIPFALMTNAKAHVYLTTALPIFLIPLFISIRAFRLESVRDDGKKLEVKK